MSNALVEIEKTVNVQLVEIAQRLYIVDVKTQAKAQNFVLNLRAEKSKALEALNPQCDANYAAWQVSLKQRKKYTEILDRAEEIAKGKLTDYEMKEEKKLKAKAQAILDKAAKREDKERKALEKRAKTAEAKGNVEKADELRFKADTHMVVPDEKIPLRVEKPDGVSSQKDYKIEVHDSMALIKAIAAGRIAIKPDTIIEWKMSGFKKYIKATGIQKIAGCDIEETRISTIKGGGK